MAFKLGDFFPKPQLNVPELELDDKRWADLEGGYRMVALDASVNLKKLEQATKLTEMNSVYEELWNDLHHQGDIGLASYYAVPHLVRIAKQSGLIDFNVFGMVAVIEIQHHKAGNPVIPKALISNYQQAIVDLSNLPSTIDEKDWSVEFTLAVLPVIALAKGQLKIAEVILELDEYRVDEIWKVFSGLKDRPEL